jgi:hypothetical protein
MAANWAAGPTGSGAATREPHVGAGALRCSRAAISAGAARLSRARGGKALRTPPEMYPLTPNQPRGRAPRRSWARCHPVTWSSASPRAPPRAPPSRPPPQGPTRLRAHGRRWRWGRRGRHCWTGTTCGAGRHPAARGPRACATCGSTTEAAAEATRGAAAGARAGARGSDEQRARDTESESVRERRFRERVRRRTRARKCGR